MNPDNPILLQAVNLSRVYHSGEQELVVLHDLDMTVYRNEFFVITGESGSGKSTLLHLLGCLDRPTEGSIHYEDRDLSALSNPDLDRTRNLEFGFVFQFHHLLPEFNALENVILPGMIAGESLSMLREKGESLLEELKLSHRMDHRPGKLSGGEQQRVAVARAMINSPSILFMDEPTGNLDPASSDELIQLIREQQAHKHLTIIMVTHNQEIARTADRHFQLVEGQLQSPRDSLK